MKRVLHILAAVFLTIILAIFVFIVIRIVGSYIVYNENIEELERYSIEAYEYELQSISDVDTEGFFRVDDIYYDIGEEGKINEDSESRIEYDEYSIIIFNYFDNAEPVLVDNILRNFYLDDIDNFTVKNSHNILYVYAKSVTLDILLFMSPMHHKMDYYSGSEYDFFVIYDDDSQRRQIVLYNKKGDVFKTIFVNDLPSDMDITDILDRLYLDYDIPVATAHGLGN